MNQRTHGQPTRLLVVLRRALVFASLSLDSLAAAADWPQWRGPNRDEVSPETGLLTAWPADGPPKLWMNAELGVGYSAPVIASEKLYILGTRNDQEVLFCLNAADGKQLWELAIGPIYPNDWGDGPRSSATVDGGRVYALGAQGNLVCADAATGQLIWRRTMEELGGATPNWGYTESPLILQEALVCTPGGEQGTIAALDKATGNTLWQSTELKDGAHYSSIVAAPIHGQLQCIQLLEARLVGIDPINGKLLWSEPWVGKTAVIPTPLVKENQVFVSSGYGAGHMLVEIAADNTVKKIYDGKEMKNHHGGMVRLGDHIFGHSDQVGWICLDWASGATTWREREALGKGALTFAEGMLYCIDEDEGNVALVKATPEKWQEVSRFRLAPQTELPRKRGKIWTHPVICDGRLYLRDLDRLIAFNIHQ